MGTRSIIVITGQARYGQGHETVRLYKHWDGYPTENLPIIAQAVARMEKSITDQPEPFRSKYPSVEGLTGMVIGEASSCYGMGAQVDEDDHGRGTKARFAEAFDPKHLGMQSDLEWIYVVDAEARSVAVYGGEYTGEVPQKAFKRGPVNPMAFVQRLRTDYQECGRSQIGEAIATLEASGWKLAEKPKRTRKPKVAAVPASV